jgi:hypothetical protein
MYSSYSFTTSALGGGDWSASRPSRALIPGKGPLVPIVQEAGWVPEPVWTQGARGKISCLCKGSNLDRHGRPVRSQTLNWANLAPTQYLSVNSWPAAASLSRASQQSPAQRLKCTIVHNELQDRTLQQSVPFPDNNELTTALLAGPGLSALALENRHFELPRKR